MVKSMVMGVAGAAKSCVIAAVRAVANVAVAVVDGVACTWVIGCGVIVVE